MFKCVKQQKDDGAKGTPAPSFIFITCNYLAILHRRGPAIAQVNTERKTVVTRRLGRHAPGNFNSKIVF